MSKERYFELYRQFLNKTISKKNYKDLMEWVADEQNDATLRRYMQTLWNQNSWQEGPQAKDWKDVKDIILQGQPKRKAKVLSIFHLPTTKLKIWYYAASVAVLLTVSYGLYQFFQPDHIIYQTAYGETQKIELQDGSLVMLNANSILEWYEGWEKSGERQVKLTGEAFFDVRHTVDDAAFIVVTNDLRVRVLGTTFNVQSRHDQTNVTLESGSIKLDLNRSGSTPIEMMPGDQVQYSVAHNTLVKEKVETIEESKSWIDGVLRFEDVSVEDMFREIEDLYGKKLITEDSSLLSRRMFTGIPYKDWKVAKEALELALDVKIIERNDELYIEN